MYLTHPRIRKNNGWGGFDVVSRSIFAREPISATRLTVSLTFPNLSFAQIVASAGPELQAAWLAEVDQGISVIGIICASDSTFLCGRDFGPGRLRCAGGDVQAISPASSCVPPRRTGTPWRSSSARNLTDQSSASTRIGSARTRPHSRCGGRKVSVGARSNCRDALRRQKARPARGAGFSPDLWLAMLECGAIPGWHQRKKMPG